MGLITLNYTVRRFYTRPGDQAKLSSQMVKFLTGLYIRVSLLSRNFSVLKMTAQGAQTTNVWPCNNAVLALTSA